jgi:cytochrome c biogenesis protein CcmG, thiol:disulfide interchange protein DsbE
VAERHARADAGEAKGVRFGFAARIGAALVAPRAAIAAADHPEDGGKSVSDLAALFGLTVLALLTAEVVTAGWILVSGEIGGGLGSLAAALSRVVSGHLTFLLVLAVAIYALAGRRRSLGRDLDLACASLVPLLVVQIAAALLFSLAGVRPSSMVHDAIAYLGYGWSMALGLLAVQHARSRGDGEVPPLRARRRWRHVGWGALAIWGVLIAMGAASVVAAPERVRPVVTGDQAPPFELPVIGEGGELGPELVALEALRGEVVVVEFWATWCGPCRASLPTLERIRAAYEEQPVTVLAVNTEGPRQAAHAHAMLAELGYQGLSVSDTGRVADLYRVTTIPHLAVIDRQGNVALVHRGFPGASAYERKLRQSIDALLR